MAQIVAKILAATFLSMATSFAVLVVTKDSNLAFTAGMIVGMSR